METVLAPPASDRREARESRRAGAEGAGATALPASFKGLGYAQQAAALAPAGALKGRGASAGAGYSAQAAALTPGAKAGAPGAGAAPVTGGEAGAAESEADESPVAGVAAKAAELGKREAEKAAGTSGKARPLPVSKPDDPLEKAADAVADRAMASKAAPLADKSSDAFCPDCGGAMVEKAPGAGAECAECGMKGGAAAGIQRKASGAGPAAAEAHPDLETPGGGSGLPADVRARVEPVVGMDLGHVRVHAGEEAAGKADQLGAKAFTHGSDIWLGAGASPTDTHLMAHEAAHVAQQADGEAGGVQRLGLEDVIPDSILNLVRGIAGQAGGVASSVGTGAAGVASAGGAEAAAVPAQLQGSAEGGVTGAKAQSESAGAEASAAAAASGAQAQQAGAVGLAKAAEMGVAGQAADVASDPVLSVTGGVAVPKADPAAAAQGSAGAEMSGVPEVAGTKGGTEAGPTGQPPVEGGTAGGAPTAPVRADGGIEAGMEVAASADKLPKEGDWNCDESYIVNKVTKAGGEAVKDLTETVKAVVPEEIQDFAGEMAGKVDAAASAVKSGVDTAKQNASKWIDDQTKPIQLAISQKAEGVGQVIESAKGAAAETLSDAKQAAAETWTDIKKDVSTGVDDVVKGARAEAAGLAARARAAAGAWWDRLPDFITSPVEDAAGAIERAVPTALSAVGDVDAAIATASANFDAWAQASADEATQWFAKKYNAAKEDVAAVATAVGEGAEAVKQGVATHGLDAYEAIDEATGGKPSAIWKAAGEKVAALKGEACDVAGDVAAPCIEKALPAPSGEGGKSFASLATTGEVSVPIYGVPVKVAAGSNITITRTGDKYTAVLTGEGSLGVSKELEGGGATPGGAGLGLAVQGTLPAKAQGMMQLGSGTPGVEIPLTKPPADAAPAQAGAAPGGQGATSGGTAPAQPAGGQAAPAQGGGQPAAAGGGGTEAKASGEVSTKLEVQATYSFDASPSKQNSCDGLGGLAAFLGAHGASSLLPAPFSSMGTAAAGALFEQNLTKVSATWADTGKLAVAAEFGGAGKAEASVTAENGVTVASEKAERKDDAGKLIRGPDGKPIQDTIMSATLYRKISGSAGLELVPNGTALLKGSASSGGGAECAISYNMGKDELDAALKMAINASVSLSGFPSILRSLPPGHQQAIQAALAKAGVSPDVHEGTVSVEIANNVEKLRELAIALDAELSKGEKAKADGCWTAISSFLAKNASTSLTVTLKVSEKILSAKLEGKDGKGTGAAAGVEIAAGQEFQLYGGKL